MLFNFHMKISHRNHMDTIREPIQNEAPCSRFVWPCCYYKLKYIHIEVNCIYIHTEVNCIYIHTKSHCYIFSATADFTYVCFLYEPHHFIEDIFYSTHVSHSKILSTTLFDFISALMLALSHQPKSKDKKEMYAGSKGSRFLAWCQHNKQLS